MFTFNKQVGYLKICTLFIIACFVSVPVTAQIPVITSFSPASGAVGTIVTINGVNFNTTPGNNTVYFGAVKASVSTATGNTLTVTVPPGATCQPITVTNNNLTAYSIRPFIPTFAGAEPTFTPGSFAPAIDSTSGLYPYGVVIVDLDGDGKPDLATANNANSPASTISVFRNTGSSGTISFTQKTDFPAPSGALAYTMAAGDVDGDGKQDLVFTNIVSNSVSVYRNTSTPGTISFASRVDFPTGTNPYRVAIADLDADGKPELAVTNFLSNTVSIFKNTGTAGTISFAPKLDLTTALAPHTVSIGDIDGDGKPDLAVTNSLSLSVSLFKNQSSSGTIAFAAKADFTTGIDEPFAVAIGDLDGDGKPDLAITNDNFNKLTEATVSLSVLRNTSSAGSFSFAPRVNFGSGDAYSLSISDLNGDGKLEVIVPGRNTFVSVYQNISAAGNITLTGPFTYNTGSPYAIAAGDLDADGKPDLAVANFIFDKVSILRNRSNEVYITSFTPDVAGINETVTINGGNFMGTTSVTFGGIAAVSFNVVTDTRITAVVGAGASGNVSVTAAKGTGTLEGFTYDNKPFIYSFTPEAAKEGDTIIITGKNFTGATSVTIGGVAATSFTVNSSTTITAIVGAGASGDVAVTTLYGTASRPGFIFFPPPVITSFTPTLGPAGTFVSITGNNFYVNNKPPVVTIGGVPVTGVYVYSTTSITVIVGSGASGDISVTTAGGTATKAGFVFIPPPAIASFSPVSGSPGDTIIIKGVHLTGVFEVTFGDFTGLSFIVVNDTIIRAVVGVGASGAIKVRNHNGQGQMAGFTFVPPPPPVIASFTPTTAISGTPVTIRGHYFLGTTAVSFGGIPADAFLVLSDSVINARINWGASGNVAVTTYFGMGSLAGLILVPSPVISSFAPVSGPVGTTVTINGSNFSSTPGNNVVYFGAVRATVSAATTSTLTVTVPKGTTWQPITVITNGLTAASKLPFTVTFEGGGITQKDAFSSVVNYPTGFRPGWVAVGDLDNDGFNDIVTCNSEAVSISVVRNNSAAGTLAFNTNADYNVPGYPYDVTISADLDGDGKLDMAIPNVNNVSVNVFRNTSVSGTISFDAPVKFPTGSSPLGITAADFDGDGKPDLVTANLYANTVSILRNKSVVGDVVFASKIDLVTGDRPMRVEAMDLNGDGKPDLVVANSGIGGTVSVFKNTSVPGNISFDQGIQFAAGYNPNGVAIGDLDGDGKPDLAVADYDSWANFFVILRNESSNGNISFGAPATYLSQGMANSVYISDVDGDGKLDVAVGANDICIYRNLSTPGTIKLAPKIDFGPSANGLRVADMDNDGKPDLVTSGYVLRNIMNGSTPVITAAGATTFCDGNNVSLISSAAVNNQWYKDGAAIPGATGITLSVTKGGTYTVTTTANGNTSSPSTGTIVTVMEAPAKPVISADPVVSGGLISSASSGNQWYIDTTTAISGATSQSYKPTDKGYYSVKVTQNGCSSPFADKYNYLLTSTVDLGGPDKFVRTAPNPATDLIHITYSFPGVYTLSVALTDINGRIIFSRTNVHSGDKLNLSGISNGMYYLKVASQNGKVNAYLPVLKL